MKKIETYYTPSQASSYESNRSNDIWLGENEAFLKLIEIIKKDPLFAREKIRLLDLPIGTGRWISLISIALEYYAGVDISKDMLAIARERFNEIKMKGTEIALINSGYQEYLPLNESKFDLVISTRFFGHFPPREAVKIFELLAGSTNSYLLVQARVTGNWQEWFREVISFVVSNPKRAYLRHKKSGRLSTSHPRHIFECAANKCGLSLVKSIVVKQDPYSSYEYWLYKNI
jgi:SAM-dependent methyltransferase